MTELELMNLIDKEKVTSLKFDGGEFQIEFESGISVTAGHTTDYDSSVWEIDSSIEIEKRQKEFEKRAKLQIEKKSRLKRELDYILSRFPESEHDHLRSLFNSI